MAHYMSSNHKARVLPSFHWHGCLKPEALSRTATTQKRGWTAGAQTPQTVEIFHQFRQRGFFVAVMKCGWSGQVPKTLQERPPIGISCDGRQCCAKSAVQPIQLTRTDVLPHPDCQMVFPFLNWLHTRQGLQNAANLMQGICPHSVDLNFQLCEPSDIPSTKPKLIRTFHKVQIKTSDASVHLVAITLTECRLADI